ncbi:hypothetical protein O6H91_15G041000 [Diphasiastrum complanatum]|uniref:Uncharacterized protein n=1 Tax=Diphasiastrum complanatum TaxID=34168 RepID=A0ACC2BHR6_DIPCM|nr:hypothetical protein O6H91_15G041000 [Diphasiastrum complanatum]
MASPDLVWQLVKKNNKFLVKRNGNSNASVQFSSEPNNLYNLNTFKFSGLANKKTVLISPAGEGLDVVLGTTKTKKGNKPANFVNKSVMRRDFRKMAKAVTNQVADNWYRPDLKQAALARLSSVHKSLRVAKAGAQKKGAKSSRKAVRS